MLLVALWCVEKFSQDLIYRDFDLTRLCVQPPPLCCSRLCEKCRKLIKKRETNSEFRREWEKVQRAHMEMCGWGERCHQSQHESAELIDESFSLARSNFPGLFHRFHSSLRKVVCAKDICVVLQWTSPFIRLGSLVEGDSESFSSWIVNTIHIHLLYWALRPFMGKPIAKG